MDNNNKMPTNLDIRQGAEFPAKNGLYICVTEETFSDGTAKCWRACYFDAGNITHNEKPRWSAYNGRMFNGKVIEWINIDIRDNDVHDDYRHPIAFGDMDRVFYTFGKFIFPEEYANRTDVSKMLTRKAVYEKYSKLYWMITQAKIRARSLQSNPIKWIRNHDFVNTILRALDTLHSEIEDDEKVDARLIFNDYRDSRRIESHVDYHKKTIMKINKIVNEKIYNIGY